MTLNKYKTIDIAIFGSLAFVLEVVNGFAIGWVGEIFALSVSVLLSSISLVRWGWLGVLVSLAGALGYSVGNRGDASQYAIYFGGSAFVVFGLIWFGVVDKGKLGTNYWIGLGFLLTNFVLVNIGRTLISLFWAQSVSVLGVFVASDSLNMVIGAIILWIAYRQKGLLVDQVLFIKDMQTQKNITTTPQDDIDDLQELDGTVDSINMLDNYKGD